jgi:hypothetical protein
LNPIAQPNRAALQHLAARQRAYAPEDPARAITCSAAARPATMKVSSRIADRHQFAADSALEGDELTPHNKIKKLDWQPGL